MHADLTIKGTTKAVDFDVEFTGVARDPWGGTRAGFTATTTINRKDFGIEWNAPLEAGGVLVGEKVAIELDVQLVQPVQPG
jgi:polyisoprenoid-binding protein YceI